MSRAREESPFEDSPSKRERVPSTSSSEGLQHYDIYLIPSFTPILPPLSPSLSSTTIAIINSATFLVVSQLSGLQTGLGIAYSLAYQPTTTPPSVQPIKNIGFNLNREEGKIHDLSRAIQLGWVEEELLGGKFEACLLSVRGGELGTLDLEARGLQGEEERERKWEEGGRKLVRDWLIEVMRILEWEGICSNGELLARGILNSLSQ